MTASPFDARDTFENETFTGLALTAADLSEKQFFRCTFENCSLQESRWKRSTLEDCTFRQCDLTRAVVSQLGLRGVRFEGCKVMGVDFSGVSSNPDVHFNECNLRYVSFTGQSLRKARFTHCQAREVNFFECDLTDADFGATDLSASNFRGCTLTRTEFRGTTGLFLDPARNKVKETRIEVETAVALAESLGFNFGDGKRSR